MEIRKKLIQYSEDVISGRTTDCFKHRQACERFLNDLIREGSEDFPYLFNEEKANRFLKWMTYFKHRKGVKAGEYIEPHIIQEFIFGNVYGWEHKDTGYRRFKKVYWQVGRKNAKSQSLALAGTYENFIYGGPSAEIYCGATKTDQAKIVWEEAEWLVRNCEFLKNKFKVSYGRINHLKSGSYIKALSKEDRKTGDGLSPQCAIIDEYHAHETSEIYDIMVSGMGARPEPLIIIITTAGYELSRPCYSVEYNYVSRILDPADEVSNEEYFVIVNELDKDDDVKDEKVWEKANPILCSYQEGIDYLRGELQTALASPEKMRTFLTKNMNYWIQQKEGGYMRMDKWRECGTDELPDLTGRECFVGIDLSSKIDLSSVTFEFDFGDYFVVLSHSFIPEERLEERVKTDRVPFDMWAKEGWITLTEGDVIDYRYIEEYIEEMVSQYNWKVKELCYDPFGATQFAQQMESKGYTPMEIPQRITQMSEATKDFREKVYGNKIVHNNNPVLNWAMGNAVIRMDPNENIMIDKKKSTERIDPVAASINAHRRAICNEDRESIYEKQDVRVI